MRILENSDLAIILQEVSEENASSISGGATNGSFDISIISLDPDNATASLTGQLYSEHHAVNGKDLVSLHLVGTGTTA